jgi:hypothetical protein
MRFLYATRSVGNDDSDISGVDVASGKAEKLLDLAGI